MKKEEQNNKELIIGIDDAGRGPVLGPMVLGGCLMYKERESELKKAGIKDSKLLTPAKREELVETLKDMILDSHFVILTPVEIDTGLGMGVNLNEVEAIASATIVNKLCEKLTNEQKKNLTIIIDCPSTNPPAWLITVDKYIKPENKKIRIKAEHKADFNYPSVSAASIIAKTTRDAEIEKHKKEVGFDFGSGYPADPYTKAALEEHSEVLLKHHLIRESWATWKNFEEKSNPNNKKAKQSKLFE